jgi:phage protein D
MANAPAFTLSLDGKDLTPTVEPRLMSLTLTEKRGDEADQLDLVLSDHDGQLALPKRGVEITLALGWRGKPLVGKGTFKVDEIEWSSSPAQVTIRARSADFTADLRIRRERSWRETLLAQVLGDVANGAGLTLKLDAELGERPVAVMAQSRESDVAFLRRLGKHYDATATIKNGSLIFAPIGSGKTSTGKTLPTVEILAADGDQAAWKVAERGTYAGVTAAWHSTSSATKHKVTAGVAKGARRLRKTFASEADAKQAAEAEWTRVQRGAGTLTYVLALGRPDLGPEIKVKTSGLKAEIDATSWLVEEATHTLADGGFTTSLQLETAS